MPMSNEIIIIGQFDLLLTEYRALFYSDSVIVVYNLTYY